MTAEELEKLLKPGVEALGYELCDLELRVAAKNGLVRLFIDAEQGIGLEDCEAVSNQVSAILDVEDPIPGEYSLEVSSPGLDRRIKTREHFERFAGQMAKIELYRAADSRRRFKGELKGISDADEVRIEVDGKDYDLPLTNIEMARLVVQLENKRGKRRGD